MLGRTAVTAADGSDIGQTWQVPARQEKKKTVENRADTQMGWSLKGGSMYQRGISRAKKEERV